MEKTIENAPSKVKQKGLTPIVTLIIVLMVVGGVAYAGWLSRQLTTSISVVAFNDLEILDTDGETVLDHIAFGALFRGSVNVFPSSGSYFIENIGQQNLKVYWYHTDWPSEDIVLKCWVDGFPLPADPTGSAGALVPVGSTVTLTFEATVAGDAAFAEYTTAVLNFEASVNNP